VVQEARQEGQPEQEKFGAEAGLWDSCQVLAHFPLEVGRSSSAVVAVCAVGYLGGGIRCRFACGCLLGLGAQSVVV
jgi:hypothetical protein